MANKLIHSFLNPVQLFNPLLDRDDRYLSKDFEDFEFPDTILSWEQKTCYAQPWQLTDVVMDQLQSNLGPINFIIRDFNTDQVVDTIQYDQKQESQNEPGLFIYELEGPLIGYEPGLYYFQVQINDKIVLQSGLQEFLEEALNTLLLEYKHYQFREDLIFETGIFPQLRVHGTKRYLGPKNKITTYEDQILNQSTLRAQKYRMWNLVIGQTYGIPDYLADILGGVIGCSDFRIDGKSYALPENSDFKSNGIDYYPKKGWSVELRERYTRGSRTYEDETPIDVQMAVAINVDSKGFGNSNTGSQTAIRDVN